MDSTRPHEPPPRAARFAARPERCRIQRPAPSERASRRPASPRRRPAAACAGWVRRRPRSSPGRARAFGVDASPDASAVARRLQRAGVELGAAERPGDRAVARQQHLLADLARRVPLGADGGGQDDLLAGGAPRDQFVLDRPVAASRECDAGIAAPAGIRHRPGRASCRRPAAGSRGRAPAGSPRGSPSRPSGFREGSRSASSRGCRRRSARATPSGSPAARRRASPRPARAPRGR